MTASQKSRLGQGLFFGVFFVLLGMMIRYWTDTGTAPFAAGTVTIVMGVLMVVWGGFAFRKVSTQAAES